MPVSVFFTSVCLCVCRNVTGLDLRLEDGKWG